MQQQIESLKKTETTLELLSRADSTITQVSEALDKLEDSNPHKQTLKDALKGLNRKYDEVALYNGMVRNDSKQVIKRTSLNKSNQERSAIVKGLEKRGILNLSKVTIELDTYKKLGMGKGEDLLRRDRVLEDEKWNLSFAILNINRLLEKAQEFNQAGKDKDGRSREF